MHLFLNIFSMGGYTFKQTRHLDRIQRLKVQDMLIEAVRDLPETTTCEGPLKDPRCSDGNGDVTNILLGAFNENDELKGALHFGSINLIESSGQTLIVETHATPVFPDLNTEEVAALILAAAQFILTNSLVSSNGTSLQIRKINYALEIPFANGGNFGAMHIEMMNAGLKIFKKGDPTRPGRKLYSIEPWPGPPNN